MTADWDAECIKLIRKLTATIYLNQSITISEAQGIMGDFTDADTMLEGMVERKLLMKSSGKYEFTFKGLTDYFAMFKDVAAKRYGSKFTDEQLLEIVRSESRRLVRT